MLLNTKKMCEPRKNVPLEWKSFKKKECISKACPDAQLSTSD